MGRNWSLFSSLLGNWTVGEELQVFTSDTRGGGARGGEGGVQGLFMLHSWSFILVVLTSFFGQWSLSLPQPYCQSTLGLLTSDSMNSCGSRPFLAPGR